MKKTNFAFYSIGLETMPAGLRALRAAHLSTIRRHPMIDPCRASIFGQWLHPEIIDEHRLFSLPAIYFESFIAIYEQNHKAPILAPTGQILASLGQSRSPTGRNAGTLLRIQKGMPSFEDTYEPNVGFSLPRPETGVPLPSLFDPKACWPSKSSHRGYGSPAIMLSGLNLPIPMVLWNLAYPALNDFTFRLSRKSCGNASCVNPFHHMNTHINARLNNAIGRLALPPFPLETSVPLPLSGADESWTSSWAAYLAWTQKLLEERYSQEAQLARESRPDPFEGLSPEELFLGDEETP